jgi:hypothetical protein
VVAWEQGRTIEWATIIPDPDDGHLGHVKVFAPENRPIRSSFPPTSNQKPETGNAAPHSRPAAIEERLGAAVGRYQELLKGEGEASTEEVRAAFDEMIEAIAAADRNRREWWVYFMAGRAAEVLEFGDYDRDSHADAEQAVAFGVPPELLPRFVDRASGILRRRWELVEAVAERLLERRELDGAEIQTILGSGGG